MNAAPLRHIPRYLAAADVIEFGCTETMCGKVIADNSMICNPTSATGATCSRCIEINLAAGVVMPPTGWPLAERDWYTLARTRIVRETTVNSDYFCVPRTYQIGEECWMFQQGGPGSPADRGWWHIHTGEGNPMIAIPAGRVEVIEVRKERPPTWEAAALSTEQVTALLAPYHPGAAEAARAWAAAGLHVAHEAMELVIRTPGPQYRPVGYIGWRLPCDENGRPPWREGYAGPSWPYPLIFDEPYQAILQDSEYRSSRRTLRLDDLPIDPVAAADANAGPH